MDKNLIEPEWKIICRLGGISAFILLGYSLITLIVLIVLGAESLTVAEYYALLQTNRIAGLLKLDLLTVIFIPFYYLLYFGFYASFRQTNGPLALLVMILAFAGVTLFLATPSVFSLNRLSDNFTAASSPEQKNALFAAGEAILASDMWNGTGARLGGILLLIAGVIISIMMLKNEAFGKVTAIIGILTQGLDLVHKITAFFIPVTIGNILMGIAGTFYLAWFPLIGWKLIRFGAEKNVMSKVL